MKAFNSLVEDGYLTKMYSRSTDMSLDTKGIHKTGGDFKLNEMSEKFDKESITYEAVKEVIKYGKNYSKWLIFAIDIEHADNICDSLISAGIASSVLHSRMSEDRRLTVAGFKTGNTKALVSVGMVTTGFDAPNVDLIVLLRPTASAVLHVQMVGRGLRIAPNKDHCLVLDFSGNTERLGPINDVMIPKQKGKGKGEPITKKCPACHCIFHPTVRICDSCGHVFKFQIKLTTQASGDDIVRKTVTKWLNVSSVQYVRHTKIGKPDSVMVIYHCGLTRVKEWIHPDHTGYVQYKAEHWAHFRGFIGEPNVDSLLRASSALDVPKRIHVDYSSRYPDIVEYDF